MPELRALLPDAGFEDVRTYVASGNVVLYSGVRADKLAAQCEKLIAERFGFDVDVIVRTADELAEVVARTRSRTWPITPSATRSASSTASPTRRRSRRCRGGGAR